MYDEGLILQRIEKRVIEAEVTTDPFPYLSVNDLFPDDFYADLVAHLPGRGGFTPYDKNLSLEANNTFCLTERAFAELSAEHAHIGAIFWAGLRRVASVLQAKLTGFTPQIFQMIFPDDWLERTADPRFKHGDFIIYDSGTNYEIGPHLDGPQICIMWLFYMPETDATPGNGTDIYSVAVEEGKQFDPLFNYFSWYPKDLVLSHAFTSHYLPNRLFAFMNTPISFHSYGPHGNLERRIYVASKVLYDAEFMDQAFHGISEKYFTLHEVLMRKWQAEKRGTEGGA